MFGFFRKRAPLELSTRDFEPSRQTAAEIADEYRNLVRDELVRARVDDCVEVSIAHASEGDDLRRAFVARVRLTSWRRKAGVRLLLALPVLQARVDRAVADSWVADVSHFGGLWLHASVQLEEAAAPDVCELLCECGDSAHAWAGDGEAIEETLRLPLEEETASLSPAVVDYLPQPA